MPQRTQLFQMLPWNGGVNTALDEALIPANQLTQADNVTIDTRGSKRVRDGVNFDYDDQTAGAASVIGLHDYWHGSTARVQKRIIVRSDRTVAYDIGGVVEELADGGTAWSGTLTTCSMITFNNLVIIAVDGANNVIKYWDGNPASDLEDLPGTPPEASMLREHLGRIFCNDKDDPDRLHYCETHDHTKWGGVGDSGAIDIGKGDGDPQGISGISPSFKGSIFVGKRTKLYRVSGLYPEEFQVSTVSSGVGVVGHNSFVAVDEQDVMFVSDRGIHSIAATDSFGDFSSGYVSTDIQRTFADEFDRSRLKYVHAAYIDNMNSVVFAVTEESASGRVNTGTAENNALWFYNIPFKAWFRWPDISCQALCVANDADKKRLYLGMKNSRIAKTSNGTFYDVNNAGTNVAVRMKLVTGLVFVDQNIYTTKALKRFVLYYKPEGTHNITCRIKVDNLTQDSANALSFSEVSGTDLLGSTFILGESTLGYSSVLGPAIRHVDGYGRGLKLTLESDSVGADVEIQGFAIEWEPAGTTYETLLRE